MQFFFLIGCWLLSLISAISLNVRVMIKLLSFDRALSTLLLFLIYRLFVVFSFLSLLFSSMLLLFLLSASLARILLKLSA